MLHSHGVRGALPIEVMVVPAAVLYVLPGLGCSADMVGAALEIRVRAAGVQFW